MGPAAIQLGVFGVQELLKHAPELIAEFQELFKSGAPTSDQWAALHARIAAKGYFQLAPNAEALNAEATAAAAN